MGVPQSEGDTLAAMLADAVACNKRLAELSDNPEPGEAHVPRRALRPKEQAVISFVRDHPGSTYSDVEAFFGDSARYVSKLMLGLHRRGFLHRARPDNCDARTPYRYWAL